jgi:hypothetical protein
MPYLNGLYIQIKQYMLTWLTSIATTSDKGHTYKLNVLVPYSQHISNV